MPMLSSLRHWFARPRTRCARLAVSRNPLHLERLEDRECPAANPTLSVGANINTGHMAGNQSETAIAVNPRNPNQLFVATNDNAANQGLYASFSTNGGATWTARVIAGGNDGLPVGNTDPTLSWDDFGNLFFGYFGGTPNLTIALSTNGGQTFTALPTTIPIVDQPTITTGAGLIAVSYLNGGVQTVSIARVTGLGQVGTFTTETVPNSNGGNFGDIAINARGQITVTFEQPSGGVGPANLLVSTDPDGLGPLGFSNPTLVTATNVGGFAPIPAQSVRTIDAEAGLAYDRSNGPHRGRLYFIYTDRASVTSNDTNVFLRFSDNNGTTWSSPIRVNDDRTVFSQFFTKISLDQTTGNVALSWYDCRNDPGFGPGDTDGIPNTDMEVYATMSVDGGLSVLPNAKVGVGPNNSAAAGHNSGNDYGDYMGLTFNRGVFYPAWVDNSRQLAGNTDRPNFDIAVAKITVVPPAQPLPRLLYPLRYIIDPITGVMRGNLTLTNVGDGPLTGPAILVFTKLPSGVTLANATGTRAGFPTITVNFASLAKNQSIRIPILLRNPLHVPVSTFFVGFGVLIVLPNT